MIHIKRADIVNKKEIMEALEAFDTNEEKLAFMVGLSFMKDKMVQWIEEL